MVLLQPAYCTVITLSSGLSQAARVIRSRSSLASPNVGRGAGGGRRGGTRRWRARRTSWAPARRRGSPTNSGPRVGRWWSGSAVDSASEAAVIQEAGDGGAAHGGGWHRFAAPTKADVRIHNRCLGQCLVHIILLPEQVARKPRRCQVKCQASKARLCGALAIACVWLRPCAS
jgi:hypothetical protein